MASQFKKNERIDFYNNLPEIVKESIEEAIKNIEDANVYTHEEVMKEVKEKFSLK